ncbi:MAG: TolC family protein [Verrucomicrobiota bacterium]
MKPLSVFLLSLSTLSVLPAAEPSTEPLPVDALVADIVAHHPELAYYTAEIDAAKAGRKTSATLAPPELSLEVGRKRVHDAAGNFAGEGATWSVSLAQTFEWPGRLALRKAIGNRQVELAELGLARFQRALAARARTLAFGLYGAQAKATAIREVADRFATLKETFLAREPAGITPQLETKVIEARELVLQRRAVDAELALQAALVELNQLRGSPANAPLRIAAARLAFHDAPPFAELFATAREQNFDFKLKRVELAQQGIEVQLARHERQPAVTVSPFYSQEKAADREKTVGIGLSLPLPVGPRACGAGDVAEARRRQAEAAVLTAERELERDVLIAAHAFATRVAETRRWTGSAAEQFREAAALADRHYRLGAVPVTTYVELQDSYLDATEALLDTQRDALESGLRLQQLTGGNFTPVEVTP